MSECVQLPDGLGDPRSWNTARDGQTLDIYIDQIDDEEFSRREQDLDILNREILAAWKSGR